MMIFILTVVSLFQSCGIRQETYLIPAEMKPRWISIEYDNPKCPPLTGSELSQEFIIPESGYLCTSSPRYHGLFQRRYFLVDTDGRRTPLRTGEQIRQESVLSKDEPSLDERQPRCKVSLDQFFYGTKDDLKEESSIFRDEFFLSVYHPECRNTGVFVPKNQP